jgi:hypothetical protein
MEKYVMAALTVTVCILFALLAFRAWKKRESRQSSLFEAPMENLPTSGELLAQAACFYVATTFSDNFLERVAGHGLGARGFSVIQVFSEGLFVKRVGERDLAISKADLVSVMFSQVTIDKAVEKDGLLVVSWLIGGVALSTHLRVNDLSDREHVFSTLTGLVSGGVKK